MRKKRPTEETTHTEGEKHTAKKKKKKKKFSLSTILLVLIFLAGLGIMLYPTFSDWWNSMHATQAIAEYTDAVEDMSEGERKRMLKKARRYNAALPNGVNFTLTPEQYAEYESLLDVTGTGIMGYIQIPSIGVNLPVYHSVEESVLQIAAGHIPGSSLPIGGKRTHAVLSGHRGLPSAKLFSELDKLKEGDVFTVTVLDQMITYRADQIRIVLPEETDELAITEGKDYCTLITCTPYGINSHRILLRGRRIKNINGDIAITSEATMIPTYIVMLAVGIPLLFLMLLVLLIYYRWKGPIRTEQELLEGIREQEKDEEKEERSE